MAKYAWNMAEPGAVKRQFEEKGEIYIVGKVRTESLKGNTIVHTDPLDIEQLEHDLLETDAENYEIDEDAVRVITSRDALVDVKQILETKWYKLEEADLQFLPTSTVELDDLVFTKFETLVQMLEEDEDVDMVWHNVA